MKNIAILILFFLTFHLHSQINSPEKYQKVEIILDDPEDINIIATLGIDLQCGAQIRKSDDVYLITIEVSERQVQSIQNQGLSTRILIDNLSVYIQERATQDLPSARAKLQRAKDESVVRSASRVGQDMGCVEDNYPVPQNFNLGSMGGFTTYAELLADLDKMAMMYPNLITVKASASPAGLTTAQGNIIYYVKVSDNPNIDENEAEVLYTGVHHAREPLSMMNLQYYLWYLLENYASDQTIKNIVDNTELYFIPMLNPDGYLYNESTNPGGGGFWRKNRRNNGDGTFGVDLNRNYGYQWGYDNSGSSPSTSSDVYRGTGPFSEPETQIVKAFAESHNFVNVFNNHAYSNLMIRPWGYDNVALSDQMLFDELGEHMCWHNRYLYGGSEILYNANGVSDDWFYGEQITKNKSLAWTPEIGSANEGGFWPLPSLIQDQCERQLRMSLIMAESATNHGIFNDVSPYAIPTLNSSLDFNIQHMSLTPGIFTMTISSTDPNVSNIANPVLTTSTLLGTSNQTLSSNITLNLGTPPGTIIPFNVVLNNGMYDVYSTTVLKVFQPTQVFYDDCSTMNNWTSSTWGVDNTSGFNSNGSITDSPSGNSATGTQFVSLTNPLNLTTYSNPTLEYYTKWDITKLNSYAQLEVSTDGSSWTPLCGEYMKPGVVNSEYINGNSDQPSNEPIYDGYQQTFVREQIDLSAYAGLATVEFRFVFVGDFSVGQGDGFWFDNFTVYERNSNCPVTIVENTNPNITMSQSAVVSIDTDGSVTTGTTIVYNAGSFVQLNPGFCVLSNTTFSAIILACQ